MTSPKPSHDPTNPPMRRILGFFGVAAVGFGLGFSTAGSEDRGLALLGLALTATGVLGGGRLIFRAVIAAFAGPRYVVLADLPIVLFAVILSMNLWASYKGPAWLPAASRGLTTLLGWSTGLLVLVCVGGVAWQVGRWVRHHRRSSGV